MDPSRIDVACRAVTYELIPRFRAQAGAGRGYWMVNRATGEVLVVTTWESEAALEAARAGAGVHRGNVAARTGLGVRSVHTMDVVASESASLSVAATPRAARAVWFAGTASDRPAGLADERRVPGFCGSYVLGDPAAGGGLALSFWEEPSRTPDEGRAAGAGRRPPRHQEVDATANPVGEFDCVGVASSAPTEP